MHSKTPKQDNDNILSPWWWPIYWLRIVYSIWFDQLWYWDNVEPQLKDKQRRKTIFVQSILGTFIVTSAISFVIVSLLAITSVQIDLKWALLGFFSGMLGSILLTVGEGENKVVDVAILGINLGVLGSLFMGLFMFFDGDIDWKLLGGMELWAGCLSLILGISYGLREGIVKYELLTSLQYFSVVFLAISTIFIFFTSLNPDGVSVREYLVLAFISVLASVPGAYLGNRWAIRQGNK